MLSLRSYFLGTNDAIQNYEVSTSQDRLGAMLDRVHSALPETVVLVSTLIPNLNAATQANIDIMNAAIPAMVQQRADAGELVYLADMDNGYITDADITTSDGTHPTDGMRTAYSAHKLLSDLNLKRATSKWRMCGILPSNKSTPIVGSLLPGSSLV
jgi:hypothetical protein